ncbi:MAG: biotin attachment protein [Actinomycetota bacterium]|nr:biotin attachment protein [Actinomycetota bacterium]
MAEAIVMPALGETSDELHIIEWLVDEGGQVELGQPLLVVETDKAEMEVESVLEGTLLRIVRAAGETVSALSVIAYVGAPGDQVPVAAETPALG